MKEINIDGIKIAYDSKQTDQCPIKLDNDVFVEDIDLSYYLIGETTMSIYDFYHADCPRLNENDYQLNDMFKQIIGRFPHGNQSQIAFNNETYLIKEIPIFITMKDYLLAVIKTDDYMNFNSKLKNVTSLEAISLDKIENHTSYKRQQLHLDGTFGKRQLLSEGHHQNCLPIQHKLEYYNEMYSFAYYSYAAMIQFLDEYHIRTYEQFHDIYGQYIYSFSIIKDGVKIPLLWPDYIYHQPENHLEFGVLSNSQQNRYLLFNDWKENDEITIEILARGFEDVCFNTRLKRPLSSKPSLCKNTYFIDEEITLSTDEVVIQELLNNHARIEIILPNNEVITHENLNYITDKNTIRLSSNQLNDVGRYQFKIISSSFGTLLVLFSIVKEG